MTGEAPSLVGRRVLVLGACGFVGQHVVRAVLEAGADVFASDRDAHRLGRLLDEAFDDVLTEELAGRTPALSCTARPADLCRDDELDELVRDVRPAATFNLAGYGVGRDERDEALATALNADLPPRLARAVARHRDPDGPGAALVHVGSALEYGEVAGDLVEDGPHAPTTLYGRTKRAGTERLAEACQAEGLAGLTARLFMLYGPGERPGRLLPTLLEAARTGADVPLSAGTQRRDFTFVVEAAEGLLRLATSAAPPPGAVCNLATGRLTSVRDFARAAAAVLDLPEERLRFGELPTRAEEMQHDPVNVERLEAWTGWRPTIPPAEGVRRTLAMLPDAPR